MCGRKNIENLSRALSRLAMPKYGDPDVAAEAASDLVLIGIDQDNRDMVSRGVDSVREVMSETEVQKKRLLTILMLGNAFLKQGWEEWLGAAPIAYRETDSCLLGFIGSLFCESGRIDHASRFFFAAFENRTSPLSWPLVALCKLNATCRTAVEELLRSDEIPFAIDRQTGQNIIKALSSRIPLIDSDVVSLMRAFAKQDVAQRLTEHATGKTEEDSEDHRQDNQISPVDWSNCVSELETAVALYKEIAEKEAMLKDAQNKREYANIADKRALGVRSCSLHGPIRRS